MLVSCGAARLDTSRDVVERSVEPALKAGATTIKIRAPRSLCHRMLHAINVERGWSSVRRIERKRGDTEMKGSAEDTRSHNASRQALP